MVLQMRRSSQLKQNEMFSIVFCLFLFAELLIKNLLIVAIAYDRECGAETVMPKTVGSASWLE